LASVSEESHCLLSCRIKISEKPFAILSIYFSRFWTLVGNMTEEEKARLLQFTTGSSLLPPGGFKELSPLFQIIFSPSFGSLPTAHTW
jgi:hypothetical protein